MKSNFIYHRGGDDTCFELNLGTSLPGNSIHCKRMHKPLTSSDVWFIQKNYTRRSVGVEINYRF